MLAPENLTAVAFYAHGRPKPQGSKRGFVQGGKVRLVEAGGDAHKDWRATVTSAALEAMGDRPLLDGALNVRLVFALPRPKAHPKTKRTWPVARPDIDKLVRSVLDSMSHVVFRDDSQVVHLQACKVWAEIDTPSGAGVAVKVTPFISQGESDG